MCQVADPTNLAGVDTGLVEPVDNGQPRCLLIGRTLSQVSSEGDVLMQVLNANLEPVKIHQGTRLGVFTPSHAICTVTEEGTSPETTLPESLDSSNLSRSQIQELKRFLVSFSDLFASPTGTLGRTSVVKHAIQTDGPPVKQQLRRMPEALKAAVKEEVQKILNQGVVRQSSSPWSSPTVLVRKRMGHGDSVWIIAKSSP